MKASRLWKNTVWTLRHTDGGPERKESWKRRHDASFGERHARQSRFKKAMLECLARRRPPRSRRTVAPTAVEDARWPSGRPPAVRLIITVTMQR